MTTEGWSFLINSNLLSGPCKITCSDILKAKYMNTPKDYYAILGVLPAAEDIVIRAAYKALAQRYHPDRFSGTREECHRKMVEINAAYAVLSDPIKRAEYDTTRSTHTAFSDDENETTFDDIDQEIRSDWQIACEYFPDLQEIYVGLGRIAHRLATTYQLFILNTKRFAERDTLAKQMEEVFLGSYFGKNRAILQFAKRLIKQGNKPALKELNRAVTILGSNVDANLIVRKIVTDFAVKGVPLRTSFSDQETRSAMSIWNVFRRAVYQGDTRAIREMALEHPALLALSESGTGNTALHTAILERQPESIRTLLELGADPRKENNFSCDAINFAQDPRYRSEHEVFAEFGFF